MKQQQIEQVIDLYNQEKTDVEIANILGVSRSRIQQIRKQLNLQTKFTYDKISKIDKERFEQLFQSGLSDAKIAETLGISYDGVYSHRIRHGYIRENRKFAKPNPINDIQMQVLIGTLIGDATMERRGVNANVICGHCSDKAEYIYYKAKFLESLNPKISEVHQYDSRTDKTYSRTVLKLPSNPELNILYEAFYKPKKIIPIELLSRFTELSLAILFMDDGCGSKNYTIATICFSKENVQQFTDFLNKKFGLSCTVQKTNSIYIKACSRDLFTSLIEPYICDCMKYKLIK